MDRDPTLSTALKLLDRLENLQETWDKQHEESTLHLSAISNQLMQRSTTLTLAKEDQIPVLLLSKQPDLIPRLVAKQTMAVEEGLIGLRGCVERLELTVGSGMGALRRDAVAKAVTAFKDRRDGGDEGDEEASYRVLAVPVIVEVASWIDSMVAAYEKEVIVLRMLVEGLKVGTESNVEDVRKRFGEQSWIDLGWEVEVRERARVMKALMRRT
ncbi:hypothetical protein HDU67_002407 [Dinochytrium kinnereticum]|nr:hypothetical protein HDU67_002407 [Dinochytrium kinnereticum]